MEMAHPTGDLEMDQNQNHPPAFNANYDHHSHHEQYTPSMSEVTSSDNVDNIISNVQKDGSTAVMEGDKLYAVY